jgi:hypothetical protein
MGSQASEVINKIKQMNFKAKAKVRAATIEAKSECRARS